MNDELRRVKQDLETIHAAAGFGSPPLGREDVFGFGFVGVAGAVWAVWSWLAGGLPFERLTLFLFVTCLAGVVWYHFAYTRGGGRTVARDRAYRWSWKLALVLGVLIDGFYVWAHFYAQLTGSLFLGAALWFAGGLLTILAITDKWRLSLLGLAAPLLVLAGSVPRVAGPDLTTWIGLAVGMGGLASATILAAQLRAATRS